MKIDGVGVDTEDHPRVCGEKAAADPFRGGIKGSPPRVRGKAVALLVASMYVRITPACAGKSE